MQNLLTARTLSAVLYPASGFLRQDRRKKDYDLYKNMQEYLLQKFEAMPGSRRATLRRILMTMS